MQKICKTPCANCSCKGEKLSIEGTTDLYGLYELRAEWKQTGEIFQCYMRNNGDGCHIHHKQILWCDKNIDKIINRLFPV